MSATFSAPNNPPPAAGPSNPSDRSNVQFPWRLHELLTEAETNGNDVIISWLHDTSAFKVHNKVRFTAEILPAYFNATKYKSFQRNLNLWGFESIQEGPSKGACYHPLFVRGDREKCHYMNRQKVKGVQGKQDGMPKAKAARIALNDVASKTSLSALADLASQASNTNVAAMKVETAKTSSSIAELKDLSFPMKLHHILARMIYNDCICWTPDGRCIRVVDPFKFQEKVSPNYFSHSSFSSFLVELESYGFKKVRHAGSQECYYHDLMIRGCPHLCKYMEDPESSRKFISNDPSEDLKIDPTFGVPNIMSQVNNSSMNHVLSGHPGQIVSPETAAAGALVQEIQQRQQLAALKLITGGGNGNSTSGLSAALGLGSLGTSYLGPSAMAAAARRSSLPGTLGLGNSAPVRAGEMSSTKTPIANLLANSSQNNSNGSGRSEAV